MTERHTVALDFGGTIATPGPPLNGATVTAALGRCGLTVLPELTAVLDVALRVAFAKARETCVEVHVGEVIRDTLARAADGLGPDELRDCLFREHPDGVVDEQAARAVRQLDQAGFTVILAANTPRTLDTRLRTLSDAGLNDSFDSVLLSSTLGVRKPDRRFFDEVVRRSRAEPGDIVMIGDTPATDVRGAHRAGLGARLVRARGSDDTSAPSFEELVDRLLAAS